MGLIPEDVISRVIDRSDIVETIGGYIPLKRAGRNFKGLCPFHHEKTPSFIVNPDKQIFHCFGCAAGGNVVHFLMKHERLQFPEAVRMLAQKAGIELPETSGSSRGEDIRQKIFEANELAVEYFHRNLVSGQTPEVRVARDYLKGRSIGLDCVRRFRLGYAYDKWDGLGHFLRQKGQDPKAVESSGLLVAREGDKGFYDRFRGRVIFPIFDHRARAVAFGARAIKKGDRAKYINSPETPVYTKGQHLYGFNLSKDAAAREDALVVVEGYMDFIRPFMAGVPNIAASLGTALTVEQVRLVRRFTRNVIMLYDMDDAGQMATLRSLDVLLLEDMNVRIATLSAGEDPDSYVLSEGVEKFRERVLEARSLFDFKFDLLSRAHGVSTIESRARICQEMIPTVDKIANEVVKSGYYRDLAQRLKVSETALLKEKEKYLRKNIPQGPVAVTGQEKASRPGALPLHADEAALLKLMVCDERWVREALAAGLTPDSFRGELARRLVGKLFEFLDAGRDLAVKSLVVRLEDVNLKDLVVSLASDEFLKSADQERMFRDCLSRLKAAELKRKRELLRQEIRRALEDNDGGKVLSLQQQFNQLIKGAR